MRKEYNLWVHWKQGDDCLNFIESEGNSVKGLVAWANFMEQNARKLKDLAELFKEENLIVDGGTHSIILDGPRDILDQAVEKGLISCEMILDYEDDMINDEQIPETIMNARDTKKTCFKCKKELSFEEFFSTNIKQYPEEQAAQLWCRKDIELHCCECFTKLKCPNCMNVLQMSLENHQPFYYCLKCLKAKLFKICDDLKESKESLWFSKLFELNNFINKMNFKEYSK